MKKLLLAAAFLAVATSAQAASMPAEFHGEWCGGGQSCSSWFLIVSRDLYVEGSEEEGKIKCAAIKAQKKVIKTLKGTNHSWELTIKCAGDDTLETEEWTVADGWLTRVHPSDGGRFDTYKRKR